MITPNDIDTFARTIYGEARGEDDEGRRLVANVIMNRYRTGYRNNRSIAAVCQDPWQFSCWNANDPNRAKLLTVDLSNKVFRECFRVALEAVDARKPVLPYLTRHYYADWIPEPSWARGKEPVAVHGHHRFYAGIA